MATSNISDLNTVNGYNGDDPSQKHAEYLQHAEQVKLINDVFNGVDSAVGYLFSFPQEGKETFTTRKNRATLRNFVKRAVQAFTGMIFRKPLEITNYGPKTTKLFNKIDTKQSIENFTKDVATALTKDGKTYILADSPSDGNSGQPYLILVHRESLINWRKDASGKFTMIVIEEVIAEPNGLFGTKYTTQWRVYDAEADIQIWRKKDVTAGKVSNKENSFYVYDTITTGFTEIPIEELTVDETPMLYDIAKLNIKHFNRMSHKDRYLTMAALPIPVIWGADVNENGETTTAKPALVIGVDEAFIFSSKEEGDFQWRELTGASITLIEDDLNSITEDITTGILRAAETASAVQKTATEVQLLQAEASNRVTAIATSVQVGMKNALALLSFINKEVVPDTATFTINKDFNASLMGSDGARVVMESYLLGLLSMDTFLQTLSDMELINIDSAKKEIDRIKADNFKPTPKTQPKDDIGVKPMDNRTTGAAEA